MEAMAAMTINPPRPAQTATTMDGTDSHVDTRNHCESTAAGYQGRPAASGIGSVPNSPSRGLVRLSITENRGSSVSPPRRSYPDLVSPQSDLYVSRTTPPLYHDSKPSSLLGAEFHPPPDMDIDRVKTPSRGSPHEHDQISPHPRPSYPPTSLLQGSPRSHTKPPSSQSQWTVSSALQAAGSYSPKDHAFQETCHAQSYHRPPSVQGPLYPTEARTGASDDGALHHRPGHYQSQAYSQSHPSLHDQSHHQRMHDPVRSVPSSPQFSHARTDRSWAEPHRHDIYAEKFSRHQRSNTTHGHVGDGMYESFSKVLSSSELRDRPSLQSSANLTITPSLLPPPTHDLRKTSEAHAASHAAVRPSASEPDLERVHGGRPAAQTNGQADYWTKPSFDMEERLRGDRLSEARGVATPFRKDTMHSRTQDEHDEQDEVDDAVDEEGEEEGEDEEEGLDDDDGEDDDQRHAWAQQDYDDTQGRMHHSLNHEGYRYGDVPYSSHQAHGPYNDSQHPPDVDGQISLSHPPLYAPHPYQPLQQYLLRPQRISKSPKQKPLQPKNSQRGPYLTRQRVLASGMEPGKGTACRYVCSYCQKRFSRPSSLRIHTYSHTGERPFKCTEKGCERQFSVQSNMRRHLRVHRMDKIKFLDPIYPSQIANERPLQSPSSVQPLSTNRDSTCTTPEAAMINEAATVSASTAEPVNPYLQVLRTNFRRLNKRLDRIRRTEAKLANGSLEEKAGIQPEQYRSINDKPEITASFKLIQTLMEAMGNIAAEEDKVHQANLERSYAVHQAREQKLEDQIRTGAMQLKAVVKLFAAHQLLFVPKPGLDASLVECRQVLSVASRSLTSYLDEATDVGEQLVGQAKQLTEDENALGTIDRVLGMANSIAALPTADMSLLKKNDNDSDGTSSLIIPNARVEENNEHDTEALESDETTTLGSEVPEPTSRRISFAGLSDVSSEESLSPRQGRATADIVAHDWPCRSDGHGDKPVVDLMNVEDVACLPATVDTTDQPRVGVEVPNEPTSEPQKNAIVQQYVGLDALGQDRGQMPASSSGLSAPLLVPLPLPSSQQIRYSSRGHAEIGLPVSEFQPPAYGELSPPTFGADQSPFLREEQPRNAHLPSVVQRFGQAQGPPSAETTQASSSWPQPAHGGECFGSDFQVQISGRGGGNRRGRRHGGAARDVGLIECARSS
ncbi:hypothetical protein DFQ27_004137 [Actinomortierella ambigua]|uniref:C2H2-type domain-containing protein n=1 Tax=Actinomortierella ambigua TaxID=1343610 RepID=A0A9P6UBH9_9FUNG|nr:hypothetical protein DFQ27_004137 [Actinomortierella ambigua]